MYSYFLVKCLFILILKINCAVSGPDKEAVYFENLIEQEIARAMRYQLPKDSSSFKPESEDYIEYGTVDYIIVGAGSAGAVIANRLSEIHKYKVLLLEAGGNESDFSDIPKMSTYLQGLEYNWNYKTTPQTTSCFGMYDNKCAYPRGRGLGGTSIINALMYVRGNKADFDAWRDAGNPGWGYSDVLAYFKKSENCSFNGDSKYHGTNGPLCVEYHKPNTELFHAFIDANGELGRKFIDYNGESQIGVGQTQFNTVHGRRQSTGKAFIRPVINRPNLQILTECLVLRVVIDNATKVAHSVIFTHNHRTYIVRASKEIILSGGVVNSAQLLMLSGIGHRQHLTEKGIKPMHDLAVGDNLQDHANYYALHFVSNYTVPVRTTAQNVEDYLKGGGPFSLAGNAEALAFLQTKMAKIAGQPDIELIILPSTARNSFTQKAYNFRNESYNSVWGKLDLSHSFTIFVILLHPKSRGTIRLVSKSPYDYPLIDTKFLSDPDGEDIERLYLGIKAALEIVKTKAFKKYNAELLYAPLPDCEEYNYLSRDYWRCQLRQLTFQLFHGVGTCKMGPRSSEGDVVNHELKVHGIKNLRVADASIIPTITSGHINAAAIMIGEKASDLIKGDAKITHSHASGGDL